MNKKISKERKDAEQSLLFYLRYWQKFQPQSREKFQYEIDKLIENLKEMD